MASELAVSGEAGTRVYPLITLSSAGLVLASWLSAAIFGFYILAFYLGAIPGSHMESWNQNLPGLYRKAIPAL